MTEQESKQESYKTANKLYLHFKKLYPDYFKYNNDLNQDNINLIITQTKTDLKNPLQIKKLITIIEQKIKKYKINISTSESYTENLAKFSSFDIKQQSSSQNTNNNNTHKNVQKIIVKEPQLLELPNIEPENINSQFEKLTNNFTHRDKERMDAMTEEVKQKKNYYILIDSKDRKKSAFPSASSFSIDFAPGDSDNNGYIDRKFANVISIELIDVLLHKTEETTAQPYLIINIDETGGLYYATNTFAKSAFCILISPKTINNDFDYYDFTDKNAIVKDFPQHRNITRLSIKILCSDGNDYDFGSSLNESNNTVAMFRFKLTCIEQSINSNYLNQN